MPRLRQMSTIASKTARGMIFPVGLLGKLIEISGPERGAQEIHVEVPIPVDIERHARDLANAQRHGFRGLVVWRDDDCVVAGVEQHPHRYVDSLLGARKAEQVFGSHRIVGLRDLRAQRGRTECLRIAETDALEGCAILGTGELEQLREGHVFAVRPRQVVLGGEFPLREINLEREVSHRLCPHDIPLDVPCVRASLPIRRTSICGYGMPMPRRRSSSTRDKLSSPATAPKSATATHGLTVICTAESASATTWITGVGSGRTRGFACTRSRMVPSARVRFDS